MELAEVRNGRIGDRMTSPLGPLQLADRAIILDTGCIVFDGTAEEVLENTQLREEYACPPF